MSLKAISLLLAVVAGAVWLNPGQLIPAALAGPPVEPDQPDRAPRSVALKLDARPGATGASRQQQLLPSVSLLCPAESFYAKVAASGDNGDKGVILSISGKLQVVASESVFVSFEVSVEAKEGQGRRQQKYDIHGSAVLSSGKPTVISSFGESQLILTAVVDGERGWGKGVARGMK